MTTDGLLGLRPALRPGILVGPALTRGPAVVHLLKDPATGMRMEVGPKEHFLLTRLDGTRSLSEIGAQYAEHFGARLGERQWQQLLRLLGSRRLLAAAARMPSDGAPAAEPGEAAPHPHRRPYSLHPQHSQHPQHPQPQRPAPDSGPHAARPAAGGPGRQAPRGGLLSGRTRMVADAPALMERLHTATAFARRPGAVAALLALAAAVLAAVAAQLGELAHATRELYHQPVALAAAGCVLWLSLGLHELAHGVVARAYGLRVGEIGLRRVAGFMTYLYCEVEDVQFLRGRGRQVAVAAAGAIANLLFLVPFWPFWALLPDSAQAKPFLGGLLLLGTAMALLNLLPLPPLDGYKAVGYALGTLRLATESRIFLTLSLRALRSPQPTPGVSPAGTPDGSAAGPARATAGAGRQAEGPRAALRRYPPRTRVLYAGYGACCLILALAALAGAGLLCRAVLPGGWDAWTPYLPLAATAAAVLLRTAGLRFAARTDSTAAARKSLPANPDGAAADTAPARTPSATPPPQREHRDMTPAHPRPAGTAVVLDGVSKRYGDVRALDGVTLTVAQGEFFGVLGPNGAGKTTLVEIVEGMRKPDAGTVRVLGLSPWPRNTALLRRIGVQTQTSAFFTRLTAWEHLETVAALHGADRAAARQALDLVGLTGKSRSRVDDLSGGQRQRLALATALVHRPDLIFLDEPTAALDPEARRSLWAVLRDLRGEGRTIVYTTHYLDEAEALCDRVAIVAAGRVVALDTPGALIRSMAAPARLLIPADRITVEQARGLDGAETVLVEGGEVVIETHHANRVLVAAASLVDMDAIQTRTATLEDAYLRLTAAPSGPGAADAGRTAAAAETEHAR